VDGDKELDIQKAIDQSTKRMTLKDLADRGFENVKVLDERTIQTLVVQAVDRVATQTTDQREQMLADARRELDRLVREHQNVRSRAHLLEADKNQLVERVEALQNQIELQKDVDAQTLHRRVHEATAELRTRIKALEGERDEASAAEDKLRQESRRRIAETGEALAASEKRRDEQDERLRGLERQMADAAQALAQVQAQRDDLEARVDEQARELLAEQERNRTQTLIVTGLKEVEQEREAEQQEMATLRAETARLRADVARLQAELDRADRDRQAQQKVIADELRAEAARLQDQHDRAVEDARSAKARLAADLEDRDRQLEDRDRRLEELQRQAREREAQQKTLADELRAEAARVQAQHDRAVEDARSAKTRLAADLEDRDRRLEELQRQAREREAQQKTLADELRAEAARVQEQHDRAVEDARSAKTRLAADLEDRDRQLEELQRQAREREVLQKAADEDLRTEVDRAMEEARALQARLHAELEDRDRLLEQLRQQGGEQIRQKAAADGLRAELEELRARFVETAREAQQKSAAEESAREARTEAASLAARLKELEDRLEGERRDRERTSIVVADLRQIEQRHQAEAQELGALRDETVQLREELAALQDVLGREQEAARRAQAETLALQTRLADAERSADRADLAKLGALLEAARKSSAIARASALRSRDAASELDRLLRRTQRPRGKRPPSLRGGAAFDGPGLLRTFFRKLLLREHLQEHVPMAERRGREHPSETLLHTIEAILAGDRAPEKIRKSVPLEVFGAPEGRNDPRDLRDLLAHLSPKAVERMDRVNDALRRQLCSLPPRPRTLDVRIDSTELGSKRGRAGRPLVWYEPDARDFRMARYRPASAPDAQGIVPFLREGLSRVPPAFARSRIRLRMEAPLFSEPVVRLLNARGVSYVIAAPESPALRKAARACAFRKLSGGWQVGEFRQRLVQGRRTVGRFVVVRHRKRPDVPGHFRDDRWAYQVFAVDPRTSPWRAVEFYASQTDDGRALLDGFADSRLLGRKRARAGLFQTWMLATNLGRWFTRRCLPEGADLRSDVFVGAPKGGLLVLPKRDRRRKVFTRAAQSILRLRPGSFRMRR